MRCLDAPCDPYTQEIRSNYRSWAPWECFSHPGPDGLQDGSSVDSFDEKKFEFFACLDVATMWQGFLLPRWRVVRVWGPRKSSRSDNLQVHVVSWLIEGQSKSRRDWTRPQTPPKNLVTCSDEQVAHCRQTSSSSCFRLFFRSAVLPRGCQRAKFSFLINATESRALVEGEIRFSLVLRDVRVEP